MVVKSCCHLFDECAVTFTVGLILSKSLGSLGSRFMLPLRDHFFIFLPFLFLLRCSKVLPVHRNKTFVWRTVKHRDVVRLISVLRAVALVVVELGNSGPVTIIGFRRSADDSGHVFLSRSQTRPQ